MAMTANPTSQPGVEGEGYTSQNIPDITGHRYRFRHDNITAGKEVGADETI